MTKKENIIKFVGTISSSGIKRLINIPKEKVNEIDESVKYYKVYLIPIYLDDDIKSKKKIQTKID